MNNKELDIIFDAEIFGGPQEKEYKDFCKSIKRLSSIKDKGNITQEIIEYREKTNEKIPIETDYSFWKKITYIQYLLDLIEQGAVFKKLKNSGDHLIFFYRFIVKNLIYFVIIFICFHRFFRHYLEVPRF